MAVDKNRREFMKNGVKAAAALFTTNLFTGNMRGANDRIRIGMIGPGHQGMGLMKTFMHNPGCELAACCDVYEPVLHKALAVARQEKQIRPSAYRDFREVVSRSDIDAVVIATPDHWHALMAVEACKAGKDVYVEKPVSLSIEEGQKMVEASRTHNRVIQVGTQQRSQGHFENAVHIVRSGFLGDVTLAEAWIDGDGPIGSPVDTDLPAGLDWNLWLGPARYRPFNENRFGMRLNDKGDFTGWSTFRRFWDYAGGMMTDWGVHLLDIVLWGLNANGPTEISSLGRKRWSDAEDNGETPHEMLVAYKFPSCMCMFRHLTHATQQNKSRLDGRGRDHGMRFEGNAGRALIVNRFGYEVLSADPIQESIRVEGDGVRVDVPLRATTEQFPTARTGGHIDNFLQCMRSRSRPVSDIEIGHRSTVMCHLGNIAYRTGETIGWDPKNERVTRGSADAHELLKHAYRKPWKLEV